jgi:rRNA maturation endonuclease Nob1
VAGLGFDPNLLHFVKQQLSGHVSGVHKHMQYMLLCLHCGRHYNCEGASCRLCSLPGLA